MKADKGILMFAHNNTEIDYIRMAVVNAMLAQKNLGLTPEQVTIVTDSATHEYGISTLGDLMNNAQYVLTDVDVKFKHSNLRAYRDTAQKIEKLPFYNANRCDAYDLSPYEQTILVDVDYLILSDALNACWNHNNELMMNWHYSDVMHDRVQPEFERIGDLGITMYWATVVYFRKTPYCETFFNFVKHVKNNREYYGNVYNWRSNIYRNDFSFSIAAHIMGGFQDKQVPQLPVKLYKTFDSDDIHSVQALNDLVLYLEKIRSPGDFILTRWRDVDLHIMNKWALNRISQDMMEVLDAA